jgi:hypothetical protein
MNKLMRALTEVFEKLGEDQSVLIYDYREIFRTLMFRAYYCLIQIENRSRSLLKILVSVVRLTA